LWLTPQRTFHKQPDEHMPIRDSKQAKEMGKKSGEVRRKKAAERATVQKRKQSAERLRREGMTILEAMKLWPEFNADTWTHWKAFLKALFGLPLPERLNSKRSHTTRDVRRRAVGSTRHG
jgi:hypothetical protein